MQIKQKDRFKKFVKKLIITHLAAILCALFFAIIVVVSLDRVVLQSLLCAFTTLIYIGLMYSAAHREGFLDYNRDKIEGIDPQMAKGLKAALFASIPNLVVIAVYLIAHFWGGEGFHSIMVVISRLHFMPFLYLLYRVSPEFPWIYFLLLIPMPLGAYIGYILGYRDFSILEHVVYKNLKISRKVTRKKKGRGN